MGSRKVTGPVFLAGMLFVGVALIGCGDSSATKETADAPSGASTSAPIKGASGGSGKGMSPKDLSIPGGSAPAQFGDKAKSGG